MTDKKWDVIDVELAAEAMMVAVDTACTAALSFASSIAFEGDEEQAGRDCEERSARDILARKAAGVHRYHVAFIDDAHHPQLQQSKDGIAGI